MQDYVKLLEILETAGQVCVAAIGHVDGLSVLGDYFCCLGDGWRATTLTCKPA